MTKTKKQQCREIFCQYMNENDGHIDRPNILNRFMEATQLSKTCVATYFQSIKKEMKL